MLRVVDLSGRRWMRKDRLASLLLARLQNTPGEPAPGGMLLLQEAFDLKPSQDRVPC